MQTQYLALSWSTSRGRDTYGYNICKLTDGHNKYSTCGGGYDMTGTVFAQYLEANFQDRLKRLHKRAGSEYRGVAGSYKAREGKHAYALYGRNEKRKVYPGLFYGMTAHYDPKGKLQKITLDGACGLSSMETIATAIGLEVKTTGNRKGHTTGFIVIDTKNK